MKHLIVAALFVCTVSALHAQERTRREKLIAGISITGKVTDAATGESLPSAHIAVRGSKAGTTTNADGFFTLKGIPSDTSTLLISYVGYGTIELRLNTNIPNQDLQIKLTPSDHLLKDVEIIAEREAILQANEKISSIKMTPASLSKLPNLGERDIMRSFQLMPGVSAANESSSGLYVRGGTPDQNLILYDGFTIYHVDHLYGFYSAFNANAIKDVQLYKGSFESRFGGRLSSVMEVTGKDGNSNNTAIGADISLLSVNAYAEIPVGKRITSLFAYRRSWKGPLYNKIFDLYQTETETPQQGPMGPGGAGGPPGGFAGSSTSTVKSFFYDLNAKVSYRPGEKDIISLSLFNGTDKLDNGQDIQAPSFPGGGQTAGFGFNITDLTKYGNTGSSIRWSRQWNSNLYINSTFGYSNYYSNRDRTNEGNFTDQSGNQNSVRQGTIENNDLKDLSFKSDIYYDASENHQLGAGIFGTRYDISYTYSQNDTAAILDRHNAGDLVGVYLQDIISLNGKRMEIIPGIRVSNFSVTSDFYFEPRLSGSYMVNDHIKVFGGTGKYYQFANRVIREDILAGSRDFWILSDDKTVPVSSAMHYGAGLSYENKLYLFSIEGYRKDYSNLSEYSLRFMPGIGEIKYSEYFYNGNGYSRGVEFLAQRKYGKLNGWVSYTLAQSQNQFDIYGENYFPASQDVRHEFKAISILELGRWNISSTWIYATGRPYTAPQGGYEITLLDGTTKDYISIGSKNGQRLPDYHRLDFAVSYMIINSKGNNAGNLGFSLFNVYNRRNVWYKEFNVADGSIVESDIRYLGITPNLSVSLKLR